MRLLSTFILCFRICLHSGLGDNSLLEKHFSPVWCITLIKWHFTNWVWASIIIWWPIKTSYRRGPITLSHDVDGLMAYLWRHGGQALCVAWQPSHSLWLSCWGGHRRPPGPPQSHTPGRYGNQLMRGTKGKLWFMAPGDGWNATLWHTHTHTHTHTQKHINRYMHTHIDTQTDIKHLDRWLHTNTNT